VQLFSEYKFVFICGNHDMGLTKAICHEIPLVAGRAELAADSPVRSREEK